MIIGLFIDIWNWFYTRSRIRLLKEAKEMWRVYRLKISIVGVLYTLIEVDKSVPEQFIGKYLIGKLRIIDDALVAVNLDGLVKFEYILHGEDKVLWYVIVKWYPVMPHWNRWYMITSAFTAAILYGIGWYFHLGRIFMVLIDKIQVYLNGLN